MRAPILVADDDRDIVRLIADTLEEEGFQVVKAYDGKEVLEKISSDIHFSMLILDIMMPEVSGLEVCRQIRKQLLIPILLLSAKNHEWDKVVGLEVGADDYITKPFSIYELSARVRAHLRREQRCRLDQGYSPVFSFSDIEINESSCEVYKSGQPVDLSTREFDVLLYLVKNENRVLSRERIYEAVWGKNHYGDIHTVTVHIKKIRDKLDSEHRHIKTVWGAGYKFVGALNK